MNLNHVKSFLIFQFSEESVCLLNCFYRSVLVAAFRPAYNRKYFLTLYNPDDTVFLYELHTNLGSLVNDIALHVFDLIDAGELPPLKK